MVLTIYVKSKQSFCLYDSTWFCTRKIMYKVIKALFNKGQLMQHSRHWLMKANTSHTFVLNLIYGFVIRLIHTRLNSKLILKTLRKI